MVHLHLCGGLPLSAHRDALILSVGSDGGLQYRRPDEIKLGYFVCSPQALGSDHYELARVHRIEEAPEDQAA